MNKEEKEAINRIQKRIKDNEDYSTNQVWLTEDVRCARVVLNLIQKQEKIIDAMKYRVVLTEKEHRMILKMLERRSNKRYEDCVVEYFKKEVENE